jgi:hypothetical protein
MPASPAFARTKGEDVKRSEQTYRWLLRLYPRDFRDEYGEEMSLLFRARGSDGLVRLWLQVLGDLIFHAPREHWSATKQDLRVRVSTASAQPRLLGRCRHHARRWDRWNHAAGVCLRHTSGRCAISVDM